MFKSASLNLVALRSGIQAPRQFKNEPIALKVDRPVQVTCLTEETCDHPPNGTCNAQPDRAISLLGKEWDQRAKNLLAAPIGVKVVYISV